MNNEIALLQLYYTPGLGNKTLFKLLKRLAFEKRSLLDFLNSSQSDKISDYKLKPDIVERLDEQLDTAVTDYEEIQKFEIQMLYVGHPEYPGAVQRPAHLGGHPGPGHLCHFSGHYRRRHLLADRTLFAGQFDQNLQRRLHRGDPGRAVDHSPVYGQYHDPHLLAQGSGY